MGLVSNKEYSVRINIRRTMIDLWIADVGIYCPYASMAALVRNWDFDRRKKGEV